ncbi:MAG: nucleoside hydrolase [Clostridia bacterium]|nr:nucleoside hydrolase [Clostridia bacterium]
MKKILIDMDIGDDIDDAIALYAAMRQGFEIVGVTTVFRNTIDRARQTKKMLTEYKHGYETVPVFAGHGTPIGRTPVQYPHIPHYTADMEDNIYCPDGTEPDDAVDFIIDACHKYGKELIVIAIGPFTNIAHVIQKDPSALNSVYKTVIMGGAYFKQYADWNVICDVTAADIMFRNLNNLECIGADVTHLMVGEEDLYDNLLNYKGSERGHIYLSELCNLWKLDRPECKLLLHDPLVVYYVADTALCEMRPASVAVITEGYAVGMTLNVDAYGKKEYFPSEYMNFDAEHKVLVAATADRENFNRRIFKDFDI